jgi:hypothetical protein
MSAGWFALAGVIIGGLLNGGVSWVLARGATRADARVAALLVSEELMASMPPLLLLKEQQVWGTLSQAHDFGERKTWEQSRSTLGHALGTDGYLTIAVAYNGLSAAAAHARGASPEAKLSDEQGWAIASTFLALNRALSYLGLIVHAPSRWKPIAHKKFRRTHRIFVEDNLKQDPKYQEFMARHGARIES